MTEPTIDTETLARAIHNCKGGSPGFGVDGECECREDVAAYLDEYNRLIAEREYLADARFLGAVEVSEAQ